MKCLATLSNHPEALHSAAASLDTALQSLVNTSSPSARHVAGDAFKPSTLTGKGGGLTGCQRGLVGAASWAGLPGFSTITRGGPKKRKCPVRGSSVDDNALLV